MREAATLIATSVLGTDGDAASALACQLFDSVMEAEGVSVPAAQVADVREGAIEGTVRRVVGDVDGTDESLARFVDRVGQLVEREARLAASSTVERNVERAAKTKTGRRVRFARVPTSSVPCPWCAMLASRGFVYKSAESAEAGSHHHCTCTIVPGVKGSTKVAGYDTEHYRDVWLNRERYERPANNIHDDSQVILRTDDDQALDYMGPAELSHPSELAAIKSDLETSGVSINVRGRDREAIGYGPASTPGQPGSMTVTEGMSYSAWLHEYTHFCDDRNAGYPGHMSYLVDLSSYARMEERAYNAEIELAASSGYNELVDLLTRKRDSVIAMIGRGEIFGNS